ncbi:barstar family protein [Photobacterium halotolerans]|uniref:Barstar (barnase inhibitor) domain-containing protein n=1 Tax=Photobacterium halotolerans TaxID=265726 RepID=A0A0F5VA92_9GAMM|nr:barstar family protein [Photobacterium halotolerans]KKC99070.1 hypothetical protein KY46_14600 [Photobacterium halotolerans]
MEIIVDWKKVEREEDFYNIFLIQVKAPEWHGRNLDALADSVVTGGINSIEPPYTIYSINSGSVPGYLAEFQQKVLSIFNEGVARNRGIRIVSE